MYLWFTFFLLNPGQCLVRVTAPCLAAACCSPGEDWDSIWAIPFSWTSNNRDWPQSSAFFSVSWSNWQLLREVIFNTHPAIHIPSSAERDLRPVTAESDTPPGPHARAEGPAVLLSKSSRGFGAAGPPGTTHVSTSATQAWSRGPRHEQNLEELLSWQDKQPPFCSCLCQGGFCWHGLPGFWGRWAQLSVLFQTGTWAGYRLTTEARYRLDSQSAVCDS